MSEIKFELKPVKEIPKRRYRKRSKYDPIIDSFMGGTESLVQLTAEERDASYLRTQLNKRIEAMGLGGRVRVSVVNDAAYLEKI
ncbi:hypothetical protein AC482_06805 [miscellaneous Crenarchaeota group-15 archaeon DG-45]|uniref:Uncharacterized protein n=1 Tax=miscellaneous Crenarchaeota group-15 archaeon DG-45 TaxID=1685127 RepID=A0A0M0BLN9_9ARCH|nr:MAG: hypothetical protein AC482_06805 [miscellaneous Crenarchaeota group-15 archaeon DG-45]